MKIIGTGSAHPKCAVTNAMLEQFLETTDEWITERTGIKERCVISSEKLEDMAALAANRALEDAGLTAKDIDFIICSNVVNEYVTPALSCIIQGLIGATCPTVDINAACAGFLFAMDMAEDKLKCNKAKNILIVCAEEPSRMVSWQNRSTCVLFGDGAGAAVVTQGDDLKAIRLTTSSLTDVLYYQRQLDNHSLFIEGEDFSVIDTPGVREILIPFEEPEKVQLSFPELHDLDCMYSTCLHKGEPGCQVPELIESGDINEDRYESYLRMLQSLEERKPQYLRKKRSGKPNY